jgi:hypothetical protein
VWVKRERESLCSFLSASVSLKSSEYQQIPILNWVGSKYSCVNLRNTKVFEVFLRTMSLVCVAGVAGVAGLLTLISLTHTGTCASDNPMPKPQTLNPKQIQVQTCASDNPMPKPQTLNPKQIQVQTCASDNPMPKPQTLNPKQIQVQTCVSDNPMNVGRAERSSTDRNQQNLKLN